MITDEKVLQKVSCALRSLMITDLHWWSWPSSCSEPTCTWLPQPTLPGLPCSTSSRPWLGWIFCFQALFCLLVPSFQASTVKFSRIPSPIFLWGCHRHHLGSVPPKRTRIPFSQNGTENHLATWREKRPSFLWGLIRSKRGARLLRFCWGGSYIHKSKDVPISTYGRVEMMPKWPGRSNFSVSIPESIHPWAYWKERAYRNSIAAKSYGVT